MNSSASIQSIVGGRFTRFCLPLTKMVMYSPLRCFFSAFSLAVSFRFRIAMVQNPPFADELLTSAAAPYTSWHKNHQSTGTHQLPPTRHERHDESRDTEESMLCSDPLQHFVRPPPQALRSRSPSMASRQAA